VVSLGTRLMFESGKAELASEEAQKHMAAIMALVQKDEEGRSYFNRVTIEGQHRRRPVRADPRSKTIGSFPRRATNITRFLVEGLGFEPAGFRPPAMPSGGRPQRI